MSNYVVDDARGDAWHLMLGDSCERIAEIPDDSVDLSVYSPPFASLYTYSDSLRDLGNSGSREEFLEHYGYIIRENLRVTRPGRIAAVHVQQITTSKAIHGHMGLTDFRGDVIRAYVDAGWILHGEVTINKDPQAQAIRTKSHALMFVTKNRDSAGSRPALADYLLIFKKPGDNQTPVKTDVSNDEWIDWAQPIWPGTADTVTREDIEAAGLVFPQSCWFGISETDTLNKGVAREDADERHICPLQLPLIERCVRLWSNPGETVFTPFAGIGSEVYTAVKFGRRGVGIELKPSYWATAVDNLRALDVKMSAPTLFS